MEIEVIREAIKSGMRKQRGGHALKHTDEEMTDAILSALEERGMVIVPMEPTDAMLAAADGVIETASEEDLQYVELRDDLAARVYRAMLASARKGGG